jgi:outer membrane lipoprotein-sorting protein
VQGLAAPQETVQPTKSTPGTSSLLRDGQLDLQSAVEYFEDLYRWDSSIAVAELTVTKPRTTRSLKMKIWSRGNDRALILIESPAREKGTATLRVEKNLWHYLPRIKRTIRIPPSMMLASWMGSDFTNDDIVRESSYSDDYTYELAGRSEEPSGWLIRFEAKPDIVGLWNRLDLVLSSDGLIPLKAEYFDRKNRLSRTIRWYEVKPFDGRLLPTRMTLVPEDKQGQKTEMVYHDIVFNADVPNSTFSLSELERSR